MLVLIPSYKRLETLPVVIGSVLANELPELLPLDNAKLIVVNNYPQNADRVNSIISKFRNHQRCNDKSWDLGVINRSVTLPPVENWYSAVNELAKEGEIVFFVGDDDPLTSNSIKCRYEALLQYDATMIFGKVNHGFYFSNEAKFVFQTKEINVYTGKIQQLCIGDIWDWTAIHLSNHCFLNNKLFKQSFEEVSEWCEQQKIGTLENRRLFITYYIPLALILKRGKIIGIDMPVLNRGISLEEVRISRFSIRSWNIGYISGLALHMLSRDNLKEISQLDQIRNNFRNVFRNWFFAIKYDDRISKLELNELLDANQIDECTITLNEKLFSLKLIIKHILRLQAFPLYLKNFIHRVPTKSVKW